MVFASGGLMPHLAKGIAGFGALATSLTLMNDRLVPSLLLLAAALVLLRGCPVCWTIGLVETLAMRVHELRARG